MNPILEQITLDVERAIVEHHLDLACDIKDPYWRQLQLTGRCSDTTGFCSAGAEAVYYLGGGKAAGLKPVVASFEEDGRKMTHWWIEDSEGNIYDPTAGQFGEEAPPYHLGRGCGFQSPKKQPTKLAQRIMQLVVRGR